MLFYDTHRGAQAHGGPAAGRHHDGPVVVVANGNPHFPVVRDDVNVRWGVVVGADDEGEAVDLTGWYGLILS